MAENGAKVTMTITMNVDGSIAVTGPFDNKILCYGMIEFARQAVMNYKAPSPIIPISEMPKGGLQ